MVSEADGGFDFTKIPAGSYLVIVNAKDFATFTLAEFAIAEQQIYEVPSVSLSVAAANMAVTVHPTEFIAAEQIRAAEKQRLMGVIPNFYDELHFRRRPAHREAEILIRRARHIRSGFDGWRRLRRRHRASDERLCGVRARRRGVRQTFCRKVCRRPQQRLSHSRGFPLAPASGSALLLFGFRLG